MQDYITVSLARKKNKKIIDIKSKERKTFNALFLLQNKIKNGSMRV